jgi:hypothetical protein
MGTIQCLIFIAGQTAARSAFRRKGPDMRAASRVGPTSAGRPAGRCWNVDELSRLSISLKTRPRARM